MKVLLRGAIAATLALTVTGAAAAEQITFTKDIEPASGTPKTASTGQKSKRTTHGRHASVFPHWYTAGESGLEAAQFLKAQKEFDSLPQAEKAGKAFRIAEGATENVIGHIDRLRLAEIFPPGSVCSGCPNS